MGIPQNAKTIWDYLTSAGFSPNATAGIEGNIEQESGGNPSAGVWPTNYGLMQWTPANAYFPSPPSMQQQLQAIVSYVQQNGSINDVNAHAQTAADAALYFSQRYERPNAALANNQNREQSATQVLQAAQSGSWPSGTQTTSSSSGNSQPATLTGFFPGGNWDPLNWPVDIFQTGQNAVQKYLMGPAENALSSMFHKIEADVWAKMKPMFIRLGLILFGAFIIYAGINGLLRKNDSPMKITVSGVKSATAKGNSSE